MKVKKLRGRWAPTPEQISLLIDCSVARMSVEKAAELIGVKPRTVWLFGKRHPGRGPRGTHRRG
jgi:hypothetical protein